MKKIQQGCPIVFGTGIHRLSSQNKDCVRDMLFGFYSLYPSPLIWIVEAMSCPTGFD